MQVRSQKGRGGATATHFRHPRSHRRQGDDRNVKRFPEALIFKARRFVHHPTLGLRVIKKKRTGVPERGERAVYCTTYKQLPALGSFPVKRALVCFWGGADL